MASETTPLLPRQIAPPTNPITTTTSPLIWPSIALPALTFLYTVSVSVGVQHSSKWPNVDWSTEDCISQLFPLLAVFSALSCLINSARKLYAHPTESEILVIAILLVCFIFDVCIAFCSAGFAARIYQEMGFRDYCPSDPGRNEMCRSRVINGLINGGIAAGVLIAILHLVLLLRGGILLKRRTTAWWRTWRFPFTIQISIKVSHREENPSEDTAS